VKVHKWDVYGRPFSQIWSHSKDSIVIHLGYYGTNKELVKEEAGYSNREEDALSTDRLNNGGQMRSVLNRNSSTANQSNGIVSQESYSEGLQL